MDVGVLSQFALGALALALFIDRFLTHRRTEWRDVADSRGERIDDLEKRLAFLEAKVEVLQSDMAKEIATLVVREINGE